MKIASFVVEALRGELVKNNRGTMTVMPLKQFGGMQVRVFVLLGEAEYMEDWAVRKAKQFLPRLHTVEKVRRID